MHSKPLHRPFCGIRLEIVGTCRPRPRPRPPPRRRLRQRPVLEGEDALRWLADHGGTWWDRTRLGRRRIRSSTVGSSRGWSGAAIAQHRLCRPDYTRLRRCPGPRLLRPSFLLGLAGLSRASIGTTRWPGTSQRTFFESSKNTRQRVVKHQSWALFCGRSSDHVHNDGEWIEPSGSCRSPGGRRGSLRSVRGRWNLPTRRRSVFHRPVRGLSICERWIDCHF